MTGAKKAPTREGQGQGFNTGLSYTAGSALSTASELIIMAMQAPDHADRLSGCLWDRLDCLLRGHYAESGAGG